MKEGRGKQRKGWGQEGRKDEGQETKERMKEAMKEKLTRNERESSEGDSLRVFSISIFITCTMDQNLDRIHNSICLVKNKTNRNQS